MRGSSVPGSFIVLTLSYTNSFGVHAGSPDQILLVLQSMTRVLCREGLLCKCHKVEARLITGADSVLCLLLTFEVGP